MSLRINTNIEAFNAHRQLERTQLDLGKSIEKLSSGLRINRAADDAAGLAISEKLRAQIRGIAQASRNAEDGDLARADGGRRPQRGARDPAARPRAGRRVRERHALAGRPQRDHGGGRAALGRGAVGSRSTTTFNQIALLGGNSTITFQVGANSGETITMSTIPVFGGSPARDQPGDLPVRDERSTSTRSTSRCRRSPTPAPISARSRTGSSTRSTTWPSTTRTCQSSESRIRDVDMASEMSNMTRLQILSQSGTAMLAQANQTPRAVLQLLQG